MLCWTGVRRRSALAMRRFDRKRHFEPLTTFLGSFACSPAWGRSRSTRRRTGSCGRSSSSPPRAGSPPWRLRARRFGLFALGALGVYAGISRLASRVHLRGRLRLLLVRRQLARHDRAALVRAAALPGGGDMRAEIAAADRNFAVRTGRRRLARRPGRSMSLPKRRSPRATRMTGCAPRRSSASSSSSSPGSVTRPPPVSGCRPSRRRRHATWESAGFAFVQMVAGAAMLGAAEWLTGGMRCGASASRRPAPGSAGAPRRRRTSGGSNG